ncbi:hypothetical protein MMC34_000303 [Xylographa carneopallida]|nr:hypothetical protein [Xylographa carneopallida]
MEVDKADDSSLASIRSISPIEDGYDVISSNMSSPMSPCYTIDTGSQGTINDNPLGSDVTPPVLFPVSAFSLDHINDDGNLANRAVRPTIPGLWEIDATVSLEVFEALKPDQPIAFEAMSHPCQGYGNEKMICHIVDSTRRIQQHSDDRLYGHGLGRPQSSMANSVYCRRSVSGDDIQMQSQLALTEGLRHVSSMLYKRSLRNLRREPVTTAVRSFIENMPLLENIIKVGLSTLRKVLSNTLPNRLMDIYAMLHVAYVVAIVINQKDVSEIQRDLYADILNWGLAIKSIDERALFANIAQLLWASEHSKLNCPRIVNNVLSGTLNQTCFTTVLPPICELSASHSSSDSRTGGFMSSQAYYNDTTALFQALKSGTAVYLCKQYLDIFEYTGILANSPRTHLEQMRGHLYAAPLPNNSDYPADWKATVTRPLLEFMGLEGFCSIVCEVQKMLERGAFRTLREAELKLIFDGQRHSRSPAKYHLFLKEIRRLCSQAVIFSAQEPFSYDNQYKRDIDEAWALLYPIQQLDKQLWKNDQQRPTTSRNRLENIVDTFQLQQNFLFLIQLSANLPQRIQRPEWLLVRLRRVLQQLLLPLQKPRPVPQPHKLDRQLQGAADALATAIVALECRLHDRLLALLTVR